MEQRSFKAEKWRRSFLYLPYQRWQAWRASWTQISVRYNDSFSSAEIQNDDRILFCGGRYCPENRFFGKSFIGGSGIAHGSLTSSWPW
jgi:hypothetical protein